MKRMSALLIAAVGFGTASAAVPSCKVPANLPRPKIEGATAGEPVRRLEIGGYTVALIWVAERCRTRARQPDDIRCGASTSGGFVLHGLWPDGKGRDWPQWCQRSGALQRQVLRKYYCATPSVQLLQHEWAKHGTCMPGSNPDYYFGQANRLFAALRYPDMDRLSRGNPRVRDVSRAFAAANPGMRPDMVRLNLGSDGWLQEIWVCYDSRLRLQRCPATQGGAPANARVQIWRTNRRT